MFSGNANFQFRGEAMSKFNVTRFVIVCLFILVMGLVATQSLAQSQASSGQIAGVVKDSAGAVIVGANVTAVNPETGFSQTAASGETGFFRIVLLPPGNYKVTVTHPGFADVTAQVSVGVGRTTDLNVALTVGGRKEEVTVAAEMIEAQRHEASVFIGDKIVAGIPLNGRRFQDIVNTTPTAQTDPSRGGISMTGQRMVNTGSINVDGADYGQLFFGGIRGGERAGFAPTLPLDSIQEFQIIRAGYTAEFGRSTGGAITAITKSGTNAFHGNAGFEWRPDSAGMSNEYYDTVLSQLKARGCSTCIVNANPNLYQWNGSVGGPVKKDKFFFFGSYDQQRQRIPHQVFYDKLATFTPTAATQEAFNVFKSFETPYQQTNDAWLFLIKGDLQLSSRHRLSARYNHSNYEGANATSVGSGIGATVTNALSNNGTEIDKTRTVVANLNSFFSHFANELRGQYARETRPRPANALLPTVSNTIGNYGTVNFLGQNSEYDYRIQFADNITWIKGAHTFKFGGEYSHLFAGQTFGFNQFGAFGSLSSDVATVLTVMGKRFDDTSATYLHQIGNLQASMKGEQFAAFLQDSWRIKHNFTLNYGLRWDGVLNPQPEANNTMVPLVQGKVFPNGKAYDPTTIPNQLSQFAPRLGFAWDPKGNGKTVIRGFGGVYFAATPMLLYAGSVNNFREPPGDLSIQLPITVPAAFAALIPGCPAPCNTVFKQLQIIGINLNSFSLTNLPNPTVAQIRQIAGAITAAQGLAFNPYNGAQPIFHDNNFSNPRSYQSGFGIEREVANGWTLALEANLIKTVHLQRNTDLNMPLSPCTDAAGRPLYRLTGTAPTGNTCAANLQSSSQLLLRPIPSLGSLQIREPSAKSLYRAITFRSTMNRRWGQINAYYTMSENIDSDYQERSAGGVNYVDRYNFAPEYSFSDLNRRHQFVAQPLFFLPWQIELSSALRLLSGAPVTATAGSDLNQDRVNNDRPYWAAGVPAQRNSFNNRALTFVDMRVQKGIKLSESKQIKLSAEMFNLFNFMNLTYSGTTVTNFCSSTSVTTCGISSFQGTPGATGWNPNANFLHLRDAATGTLLTTNNAGTPFEAQFSFKFIF
jgi:carboxypeptidase family protein/TonB-dependent receptor-like protein